MAPLGRPDDVVSGGAKDGESVEVNTGHAAYLDFGYRFLYLGDAKTTAFDADGVTSTEKLERHHGASDFVSVCVTT